MSSEHRDAASACTLDATTHAALAGRLHEAQRTRTQVGQFSLQHPCMTIADAYAVQAAWLQLRQAEGRRVLGHKIGLTSRAMQMASQIDEPDSAPLMDDMFIEPGGDIALERFIAPRVEVELAFVLARGLEGPDVTLLQVLQATEYVVPAIEIIDARIEQFDRGTRRPRRVVDTISDFAANAAVVLGGRPVRPDAVDLRWVAALLHRNGGIEESGVAAAVLNHPATGVAWLARRMAQHGGRLAAGDTILAGSFTRPVAGSRGDVFSADYGPLGSISFRFA